MALSKLGDYIEQADLRNREGIYPLDSVRGISIEKCFISTKANMENVPLSNYKIVSPNQFSYVTITSRNGGKISLAHNDTQESYLVSSSYLVFFIKNPEKLHPKFLYMFFNRPEFDRFSRFNSWGSAREAFSWDDMCDIDIDLPPIEIQQKYVDVYNAMVLNQKSYEQGLEDLKLTCDAYLDELRRDLPHEEIGQYLHPCEDKNQGLKLGVESVKGISIEKKFIETKANMKGVSLKPYLYVKPDEFSFVTITSRNGGKISIAHNNTFETYLVSSSYVVFGVNDKEKLLPAFLNLFFCRAEFDRYSRYNSWGSAREAFSWGDMCEVQIPIPDIGLQQSIVDIYKAYLTRREINEKMKAQIKDLCPILIKGSIEEAQKAEVGR